jgi:hypothetical protein
MKAGLISFTKVTQVWSQFQPGPTNILGGVLKFWNLSFGVDPKEGWVRFDLIWFVFDWVIGYDLMGWDGMGCVCRRAGNSYDVIFYRMWVNILVHIIIMETKERVVIDWCLIGGPLFCQYILHYIYDSRACCLSHATFLVWGIEWTLLWVSWSAYRC